MYAITTTYYPPTNTRSAKYKADNGEKTLKLGRNDDLSVEENHKEVAVALCRKLGIKGTLSGGYTKTGMRWTIIKPSLTVEI